MHVVLTSTQELLRREVAAGRESSLVVRTDLHRQRKFSDYFDVSSAVHEDVGGLGIADGRTQLVALLGSFHQHIDKGEDYLDEISIAAEVGINDPILGGEQHITDWLFAGVCHFGLPILEVLAIGDMQSGAEDVVVREDLEGL
ncbi:unnamed protein product [Sphagnum balticum]